VPVGFITGQLESERALGERRAREPVVLPSGFVTMLMTDVEGSTGLLHHLGDAYREMLDAVRTILRDAAIGRDGLVVETRADELFAVFESPAAALEMAVSAQRDLRQRTWTHGLDVRVRIGIHSGYPTVADANYIGMAVHTTARVTAAAHGGQIVVSGDTRTAVWGAAPQGVRFRALGAYRLRGIPDEVPLFQVAAKGLVTRFPQLRGASPA
jgi:class 3 adenylate cyclase